MDAAYNLHLGESGKAGKGGKRRRSCPGSWWREARRWNWKGRAEAWDIHVLTQEAAHGVVAYLELLNETASRAIRWIRESKRCSDPGWPNALETLRTFGELITEAAIEAALRQSDKMSGTLTSGS
jgi:hypothetical protein